MSPKRHILYLCFCLVALFSKAQTEAELKENAEQLFLKEQYVEATPLFLRLLSLQPRSFEYNYKYGTCLLYNSNKKEDAIRYLSYAVKDGATDPEAFFFLGKAYHLNFQFNNAITEYQTYQQKATAKGKYYKEAERNMEMCRNGKKLLSTITEIIVTKKTEIKSSDFFRIYDLSNIGGSIVVAVDFQTKMDKKMGHVPIVHFPVGTDKIFFGSYGDGTQMDIYMVRRLPDGKFSLPQKIEGGVNSAFDEDFPYLHPKDGYLYFSSKGHNSMGGYDVFRCKFIEESNSFGPAENIDFAISSPDDDIMYMVDKDDKTAFFASARQSQDGKLYVYEVMVDRVPIQLAIVKGKFESGINPENKKMSVEVIDLLTEKNIGKFNSTKDGTYLITFPKGGKYEYRVTVDGSNEKFVATVEIPFLKEFKPLKQKLLHEAPDGKEKIRVVNLFNEDVEDAQAIIAQVLKQRSDLNVNVNDFNTEELENAQKTKQILADLGMSELSIFELGQLLENKSNELAKQTATSASDNSASNAFVLEKVAEINKLDKEIKELVKEADQSESDVVQHSLLKEAQALAAERNIKLKEMNDVQQLQSKISGNGISEATKKEFTSDANAIQAAIKEGDETKALALIDANKNVLKEVLQANEKSTAITELVAKQAELDSKLNELYASETAFTKDIELLEAEIRTLEEQKGNVKDKFKQEIQDKIDAKQAQLNDFKIERDFVRKKEENLSNERKLIANELDAINSLQNYQGPKVSEAEAAQAKKSLNNENANSIDQYIDAQIAELVKNNPDLEFSNGKLTETSKIIAAYNSKAEKLLGSESNAKNTQELIALNNETIDVLQERIAVINNLLIEDRFNEQLRKEKANNEKFISRLQKENQELQNSSSNQNDVTYTSTDLEKELSPNYSENNRSIESNPELSASEKNKLFNELDQNYLAAIEKELATIQKEKQQTQNNANAVAKEKALLIEQEKVKNAIDNRSSIIVETKEYTSESLQKELDPEYESTKQAIEANNQLSKIEQNIALSKADNTYLKAIEKELISVQKQLQKDLNNSDLLAKEKALLSEQERVNQLIEARKTTENIATTYTPESLRVELDPEYSNQKQAITSNKNLTAEERLEELNQLDANYLSNLQSELTKVTNQLSNDPRNETLISKKNSIESELVSIQNIMEQRSEEKAQLASNSTNQKLDDTFVLAEIDASYGDKYDAIMHNSKLTEQEKLKQLQALDQKLLNAIQTMMNREQNNVVQNPNDVVAIQKLEIAEKIFNTKKAEIKEREVELQQLNENNALVTPSKSTEELTMEINERMNSSIEQSREAIASSDKSENEKQKELLIAENNYLKELQKEEKTQTKSLSKDKDNLNLKAEVDILRSMIESQKERIATVGSVNSTPTNNAIVEQIDPNYQKEVTALEKLNSNDKYEKLVARELAHQQKVEEEIARIQNEPSSDEQATQLASLSAEYQKSIDRANEFRAKQIEGSENVIVPLNKEEFVAELHRNLLEQSPNLLSETSTDLSDLKVQEQQLLAYEKQLLNLKSEKEKTVKQNPSAKEEIALIANEIETVKRKRREVSVSIGELEQSNLANGSSEEKLQQLAEQEQALITELNNGELSQTEKRAIEVKRSAIVDQKAQIENPIIASKITQQENEIELLNTSENGSSEQKEALVQAQKTAQDLIKQSEKASSEIAKNYLLKEAENKQSEAISTYVDHVMDDEITKIEQENEINSLQTKEELEARKRSFIVEIGTISQEIKRANIQKETAKSKELPEINATITTLEKRKIVLESQVDAIDAKLASFTTNEPVIATTALEKEVSYQEEFEIAATENYANYAKTANEISILEKRKLDLESEMQREKAMILALVEQEVTNSEDLSYSIEESTKKVRQFSVEIGEIDTQLERKKNLLAQQTPDNKEEEMKFNNLVLRGINPIKKVAIAAAMVPLSANGIEIAAAGTNTANKVPIAVGVTVPTGLVYRVQVGAFARPIPEELFKEFTPVSGELIANTNITRYMAGYFNNSEKVVNARDEIKTLGYSDAFVVAYCDGERIPFGEARELERTGKCVPKGDNELMLEVAQNTAQKLGYSDTTKIKVSNSAYNQAPGAVQADAIEDIKGLFFTVQIAVYNKPVPASQLLNIEPLITMRLPNGQIRYSTGVYQDYQSAVTKQNIVKAKGITDAFVAAYYNGERISWQEGMALLEQQGKGILTDAKNGVAKTSTKVEDRIVQNSKTIEVFTPVNEIEDESKAKFGIQIVSKTKYTEYPREVLNRYNAKGSFYFDNEDGKVKSVVYDSEYRLPRINAFKNDVDTVYLTEEMKDAMESNQLIVKIPETKLPGDFTDWMLKINQRRAIKQSENGLEIRIFDLSKEAMQKAEAELAVFGLETEVQQKAELGEGN